MGSTTSIIDLRPNMGRSSSFQTSKTSKQQGDHSLKHASSLPSHSFRLENSLNQTKNPSRLLKPKDSLPNLYTSSSTAANLSAANNTVQQFLLPSPSFCKPIDEPKYNEETFFLSKVISYSPKTKEKYGSLIVLSSKNPQNQGSPKNPIFITPPLSPGRHCSPMRSVSEERRALRIERLEAANQKQYRLTSPRYARNILSPTRQQVVR